MVSTNEHTQASSTPSSEETYYTIEQMATRTALTKRTLRYYEEVGLLPPADRTGGNYRRYTEEDIARVGRIKELRDLLGFSLNDIRELLLAEEERGQIKLANQQETDSLLKLTRLERADELIREQVRMIEQKIAGLAQMRTSLLTRLESHEHFKQQLRADIQK